MADLQRYKNRSQAGKLLSQQLAHYTDRGDAIVLGLPRGGVPVAYAVARALRLPLDILLVRKLGMPGHEEYAMGAVGSGGVRVLQPEVVDFFRLAPGVIEAATKRELVELDRRERSYRGERPPLRLGGKVAVLVDDGLATGSSMRAAVEVARRHDPARVVVAVPVGAPDSCEALAAEVDELICPRQPPHFHAVSQWYREFDQTSDDEVHELLALAWRDAGAAPQDARASGSIQGIRE
jgi:putative phosphoribosyl transferase